MSLLLTALISPLIPRTHARTHTHTHTHTHTQEDLAEYLTDIEFKVCISAVTVSRFVCEHADAMPLSVVSRITDIHDYLIIIIPLIENPPWTRRNADSGTCVRVFVSFCLSLSLTHTHTHTHTHTPMYTNLHLHLCPTGAWEKLVDFKWEAVAPIDLLKVTKLEGQPWLALYVYMCICIYVCTYVYVYICVCVCISSSVCLSPFFPSH